MCFFSLFLVTRPRSFWLKIKKKKKKKKNQCQNQTKVVHSASRSATGARHLHVALADSRLSGRCNFFTVIVRRRRDKNVLLLRSLMEEDDWINVSHHSLFKKHDAFHSCTFIQNLSNFQCLLAMAKRQFSASESGHGEPKSTMPPVEIAEHRLC